MILRRIGRDLSLIHISQGYHDLEIARMFQVKPGEIKLEMDQARSKVVPFPTETAALAA